MLVVCVLLLLGFNARGQESDSNEQHTTEPSVEPQENPEQESVAVDEDGPRRDDGDVTPTEVRFYILIIVHSYRSFIFADDFRISMECYQT